MRVADRALVRLLPAVPRAVVQRLSAPYIAGPTLDDARQTVARLNADGKLATVDVLGEEVHGAVRGARRSRPRITLPSMRSPQTVSMRTSR